MASSKQKGVLWLIIAGVFAWTVYILSGKDFSKMADNVKASVMPSQK